MLGLDKQLRSFRGSLKVEVAKKVELEEHITKEQQKLEEFEEYPRVYDDAMKEDITKRIDALNYELATRQESISLLKGRLKNQITSFKETIAKVLDKETSLGEKIRTLFSLKGWIRNKLKSLASPLGKLGMKAAEALPSIIGGILSWILNRAKDVVGWVSQNLWALVVGIGGLIYTYMVTRK